MEYYLDFFRKVGEAYGASGGHNTLLERIDSGEFKDGLSELQYGIAIAELHEFFRNRNTHGNNRVFGLGIFEITGLVKKCEEKEKSLNRNHQ